MIRNAVPVTVPDAARKSAKTSNKARRTATWITVSSARARMREPSPAVSNWRTTASGVTSRPSPLCTPIPYRVLDIDRFIASNAAAWTRLESLTPRANRDVCPLNEEELDEFVRLYQRTSTNLSFAQTNFADPGLSLRLSQLVGGSGAVISGTGPATLCAF